LAYHTLAHHRNAIGQGKRFRLVVGYINRGDPDLLLQTPDLTAHQYPHLRVEIAERLVQQQQPRSQHQRSGKRHALLLTS